MGVNPLHIIYGVVSVVMIGYLYNCEVTKSAQAKAVIVAQIARDAAEKETKRLKGEKEKADVENKRTMDELTARIKRLRAASGVGRVPPAPPASRRPDLAAFDRADYERAYRELVQEIRGIADEGTADAVALNTARAWSNSALRPRPPE